MADWGYGLSQGIAAGANTAGGLIDASIKRDAAEDAESRAADRRLADQERLMAAQEAMNDRIAESAYQRQQRPNMAAGELLREAGASQVPATPEYGNNPRVNVTGTPEEVRAKLSAIPDPQGRADALAALDAQEQAQRDAQGKTRAPSREEQIQIALENAIKRGDAASYERLKLLAGDKFVPVPEGGLLNTTTGELVGSGTSKADREREKDQRQFENRLALQREEEAARDARADKAAASAVARDEAKVTREGSKPLPGQALKMQQTELDAIGTASGIQDQIGKVEKQIADGKLEFGPVSNILNRGLNAAGMSSEESRNFASFQSTMEKLRNDSLRLNAGVQTDGDAQRAWNELFANINDTDVVKQRLSEIRGINERAVQLRKLNVDQIRANYSKEPFDFSKYEKPGGGGTDGKPAARPTLDEIFK